MAPAPGTDSYRPSTNPAEDSRPRAPPNGQKAMYEFQGNRRQGRGGPPQRGEFTFRQRMRISDRPLLTDLRAFSPDPLFRGEQPTEKFRQVDDLTDSDEKDMDVSQSGDEGPPSKKLRSGPSWSNPDPYTALPPVAETQKKKQDVVKLIRKSRVLLPAVDSQSSTAAHGEDFISLDMGDSNLEGNAEDSNEAPANAPTGPKSQPLDAPTQLGKRKRGDKLPPRSRKGATLHQQGRILREWKGSDVDPSTPWFRPPATADILAGVA